MKDTFTIKEVALMTGLTTRTLRNYISLGFLEGDKVDGIWEFNTEQLEKFMQNDAVRPAITAKKNAIVYDFMGTKAQGQDKMCVILDIDSIKAIEATNCFCKNISECEPDAELRFASNNMGKSTRIILSGSAKDVMKLVNDYYSE